jgi:hypothetical protein
MIEKRTNQMWTCPNLVPSNAEKAFEREGLPLNMNTQVVLMRKANYLVALRNMEV